MSWSHQNEKYDPIPSIEQEAHPGSSVSSSSSSDLKFSSENILPCDRVYALPFDRKRLVLVFASAGTILLIFFSLLFIGTSISSKAPTSPYADIHAVPVKSDFLISKPWNASTPSPCGDTIESARAAGCQWSSMIWAWFPAACYDWDLEEEFLAESEWEWFSSRDLHPSTKLSREAVLHGDEPDAYVTGTYHKTHCVYAFKKLFRSLLGVSLGDNYLLTSGHMHHCSGNTLKDGWGTTRGVAKWLDCVAL